MSTMMENKIGRVIALRLGPDEDLLQGIVGACQEYDFKNAVLLSGIGSLRRVRVVNEVPVEIKGSEIIYGYDDEPKTWGDRQGVLELCSTKGSVRMEMPGTPQAELYITFSSAVGAVLGGRLMEGTLVKLTAEIIIGEVL